MGENTVEYGYDHDGLMTSANLSNVTQTLTRDADNGLLLGTILGRVTDTWNYNSFAEPVGYIARVDGAEVFRTAFGSDAVGRDKLGRIVDKTETVAGTSHATHYTYDPAGRLDTVTIDGELAADYDYDSNSNRLTQMFGAGSPLLGKTLPCVGTLASPGTISGGADAQDRLSNYGTCTFTYGAAGELQTRIDTATSQTTGYNYDVFGNLRHVALPNGTALDYVIDGQHRRIGKKRNGKLEQGFVYATERRPVAELDGAGNVIATFVYADRVNVPSYILKGGNTYRVISDHLGSPRLVIDIVSGTIAQRMDFDEWGNILNDTNPGFQPFGFAGGIFDRDTGLTRFGARDYDPVTGRWVSKDVDGVIAGHMNLYAYVSNNPISFVDLDGFTQCDIDFALQFATANVTDQTIPKDVATGALERSGHSMEMGRTDHGYDGSGVPLNDFKVTLDNEFLGELDHFQMEDLLETIIHLISVEPQPPVA